MKRLLTLLGSIGLVASSASTAVSCASVSVSTVNATVDKTDDGTIASYKTSIQFYKGAKMLGVDPNSDKDHRDIEPGKEIIASTGQINYPFREYPFHVVRATKENTKLDSIYNHENDKFKVRFFLDEKWSLDKLTYNCEIESLQSIKVRVEISGLTNEKGNSLKLDNGKKKVGTEKYALIRTYEDNERDDGQKQPPLPGKGVTRIFKIVNYINVPIFE